MASTYLIHTPSPYCFRLIVPLNLRPHIGLSEIRRSLKTRSLSLAKERSHHIVGRLQKLFRNIRKDKGTTIMNQLTRDHIQGIIRDYIWESLVVSSYYFPYFFWWFCQRLSQYHIVYSI